jgi:hypothetical protein
MRPLAMLAALSLVVPVLGAEPDAQSCKASLAPWIGKDAAALEKQWGPPAEVSKWRGGTKRVFEFAKRSPVEASATTPLPGSPNPERLDRSSDGPGSSTTYSKSYSKEKGQPAEWKESPRPETWLPSAYVFHVSKEGVIKKADCRFGPPE